MSKVTKTIISIVVVAALGYAAFFVMNDSKTVNFKKEDSEFAVKDIESLTMIFLADKRGNRNKLVKQPNGKWQVNEDYYVAEHMMELLLRTLQQVQVKNPVPNAMHNMAVKNLGVVGIKVELYAGEHLKTFYVGGTTNDDLGTFFIMEGSETPFVCHIPGFDGFLTSRFEIKRANWIDRSYFTSPKSEIKSIMVKYGSGSDEDFTITADNGSFGVDNISNLDSSTLNKYLNYYSNTHFESYVNTEDRQQLQDSLEAEIPFCTIQMEHQDVKQSRLLKLYPFKSLDRMYGITEQGDLITAQYFNFNQLMVKKSFFEKAKPEL